MTQTKHLTLLAVAFAALIIAISVRRSTLAQDPGSVEMQLAPLEEQGNGGTVAADGAQQSSTEGESSSTMTEESEAPAGDPATVEPLVMPSPLLFQEETVQILPAEPEPVPSIEEQNPYGDSSAGEPISAPPSGPFPLPKPAVTHDAAEERGQFLEEAVAYAQENPAQAGTAAAAATAGLGALSSETARSWFWGLLRKLFRFGKGKAEDKLKDKAKEKLGIDGGSKN